MIDGIAIVHRTNKLRLLTGGQRLLPKQISPIYINRDAWRSARFRTRDRKRGTYGSILAFDTVGECINKQKDATSFEAIIASLSPLLRYCHNAYRYHSGTVAVILIIAVAPLLRLSLSSPQYCCHYRPLFPFSSPLAAPNLPLSAPNEQTLRFANVPVSDRTRLGSRILGTQRNFIRRGEFLNRMIITLVRSRRFSCVLNTFPFFFSLPRQRSPPIGLRLRRAVPKLVL